MKPRTKLHREVVDLASALRPITQSQKEWAYKECLPHKGYANKSGVFCLDCGETFSLDLVKRKKAVCPHCKTKVIVELSQKRTYNCVNYFAITQVFGDFQVVRNYEISARYHKGFRATYILEEILQNWIQPNNKITLFGLSHTTQGYCDSWGGQMEIREFSKNYYNQSKYDVYPRKYHPDSRFKPEYKKIGIDHNLSGLTVHEAIKMIPNNPKLETLIKAKQYSLLTKGESYQINSFWPTIKICLRNKFIVKDVSIWMDYLELLKYFKKDLRNSKFVCPKNLSLEHDKLIKKKRAILAIEEQERDRLRVIERQKRLEVEIVQYIEHNKKFFDLEFKKGNISIKLLQSIDEFKAEGDELKHCVFTNEYYRRQDSLIFSARVNGKRAETVEVKIDKMKISQSRGISNQPSKYNNEIVDLMTKNLSKIRAILKKEKQFLKQTA
jgi:DNA-directed RNA polymerase subunit RPC12/RpoP